MHKLFFVNFGVIFLKKEHGKSFLEQVVEYFENEGYSVDAAQGSVGIPDLHVYNKDEEFFVEVKTNRKDGLRDTQIWWMVKFPNKKVIVVFRDRVPLQKDRSRLPITTWRRLGKM